MFTYVACTVLAWFPAPLSADGGHYIETLIKRGCLYSRAYLWTCLDYSNGLCILHSYIICVKSLVIPRHQRQKEFSHFQDITLSRHHTFNIPMYKIITTCIECATVLQANSTCTTREYACFPIHDWWTDVWLLEDKAIFKKPETLNSMVFYFK